METYFSVFYCMYPSNWFSVREKVVTVIILWLCVLVMIRS